MKKITKVVFEYDDGTTDTIEDRKAAALFQSRINSSGIVSGFYDFIISSEDKNEEENE